MLLMLFCILTVKAAPATLHTSVSQLRLISYLAIRLATLTLCLAAGPERRPILLNVGPQLR